MAGHLGLTPEKLHETVSKVPKLGDVGIIEAAHMAPKVLSRSIENLLEVERILEVST